MEQLRPRSCCVGLVEPGSVRGEGELRVLLKLES